MLTNNHHHFCITSSGFLEKLCRTVCRILLLFFAFAEVSGLHKLTKTGLQIFFWISLILSYLNRCIKMKGKRLKRYKIKITYSEPNFAHQVKIILLLLFAFQFNQMIQSKCEQEMLFHGQCKSLPLFLTRVGLRDYFYVGICLRPNYFKFFSSRYLILMLLLISGNVHPHPGPCSVRHNCSLCRKNACLEERIICCNACDSWCHVACLNVSFPQGEPNGNSAAWICNLCSSCNFSSDLLSSRIANFNSINSFSILDEVPEQHHVANLNSKLDDIHHLTCDNQALKFLL